MAVAQRQHVSEPVPSSLLLILIAIVATSIIDSVVSQ